MRRVAHALVPFSLLVLAALPPGGVRAQAPVASWTLEGVGDRFCISYLVEPGVAAKQLGSRFKPAPAGGAESLHPAVAQVLAGEPMYSSWVPAEICVIEAARVVSGGRSTPDGSRPVVLGYAALAATPVGGGARSMHGTLFSTSGTTRRLATDQLIHVDDADYVRGVVPEGTDQRRSLSYKGATVTWDGRVLDPANPATPHPVSLSVEGKRNRMLAVSLAHSAEWERALVGTLKVRGKSDFAAGLVGSPIRMVGPVRGGGTITLEFTR